MTPFTIIGAAFARDLFGSPLYNLNSTQWVAAVEDAFTLLQGHLLIESTRINLRADQPADLTVAGQGTFNSQARYGLLLHALGTLADEEARMSNQTSASMNTLTLTRLLAQDIGGDARSSAPLFNGRTASGQLVHGIVNLTSYETRVNLAVAAVDFMTNNARYKAPFTQLDVAPLLDQVSSDGNPRLYPASDPPLPYDTVPPDNVGFTTNTPADHTVLRGDVTIEATAHDNRALGSFAWIAPTGQGAITGIRLDPTAGLAGPWSLGGVLHTDLFPEGDVVVTAKAIDQASNVQTVSRTFVVDRTSPAIAFGSAMTTAGWALQPGDFTGPTTVTVTGSLAEAHLASATYAVNGSVAPLPLGGDGSWMVAIPLAATGAYVLVVNATDAAGNQAQALSLTFNCDATPPTIAVVPSMFTDDTGRPATRRPNFVGARRATILGPPGSDRACPPVAPPSQSS